ncbi:MAG: crotonase/enoyl-CoA hydratase family protein [Acidimicrobiales bacterium]|nr:crotonase/enoyl-CoA hydratase family protein [Acidimicrobiales bacterium]
MSVDTKRVGNVEIITINRPEARNAIDGPTSTAIGEALDAIENDDEVWVVVLTGAGDKAFCAGMDLKAFASGQVGEIVGAKGGFASIATRDFPKPIIAAINGAAFAGGCEIMLSCDLVVASEHATFGIPEVKRGLIAGGGGLIRLPRRLPLSVALELALTGDPIDASRAFNLGLVNKVVPHEQLMEAALELAQKIAENAPLAVRASKKVMYASLGKDEKEGWAISNEAFGKIFASPDAMEGAIAFAEKRKPNWALH